MPEDEIDSLGRSPEERRRQRINILLIELHAWGGILILTAVVGLIGYFTVTLAARHSLRSVWFYVILGGGCWLALAAISLFQRGSKKTWQWIHKWMFRHLRDKPGPEKENHP
jgi:hypothetical protein